MNRATTNTPAKSAQLQNSGEAGWIAAKAVWLATKAGWLAKKAGWLAPKARDSTKAESMSRDGDMVDYNSKSEICILVTSKL